MRTSWIVRIAVPAFALFVALASSAGAQRSTRPAVLSRAAVAGPAASETRIAWLAVDTRNCTHVRVRTTPSLLNRDLPKAACYEEGPEASIFAWGNGVALWVDIYCGNNCYENVGILGARGRRWRPLGVPPDGADGASDDYVIGAYGDGAAPAAAAGDDRWLLYSVVDREVSDPNCGQVEGASCAATIASGKLWSFEHGRWRKLQASWPVGLLSVSGDSVALAQADDRLPSLLGAGSEIPTTVAPGGADGTHLEIRNVRTWQLERALTLAPIRRVALAPHYLAVATADDVLTVYRRPSGSLFLRRRIPDVASVGTGAGGESLPSPLAASDAGIAYLAKRRTGYAIAVVRRNGSTFWIDVGTRRPAEVGLSGRRLAWRTGATVRTLLLR